MDKARKNKGEAPPMDGLALDVARGTFLRALGIDLSRLDDRQRAIVEALSEEVLALRDECEDLKSALAEASSLADHDTLVPAFNRRAFLRELRREIALANRFGTPVTLVYIDLDGFKAVNDRFGHAMGDQVLMRVASLLRSHIRDTDILARLGGDEFGILLAKADETAGRAKAAQLSQLINRLKVKGRDARVNDVLSLGASCGVKQWRAGWTPDLLISEADAEMYADKKRRRASQGGA